MAILLLQCQAQKNDPTMKEHTNALIHETSPYLLQHAHNPVDWMPWGEEAFEKAKKENKLVIGLLPPNSPLVWVTTPQPTQTPFRFANS